MSSQWPIRKRWTLLPLGVAALSIAPSCGPTGTEDAQKAIIVTRSGTGRQSRDGRRRNLCRNRLLSSVCTGDERHAHRDGGPGFDVRGLERCLYGDEPDPTSSFRRTQTKTVTVDAKFDTQYVPPAVTLTVAKSGGHRRWFHRRTAR